MEDVGVVLAIAVDEEPILAGLLGNASAAPVIGRRRNGRPFERPAEIGDADGFELDHGKSRRWKLARCSGTPWPWPQLPPVGSDLRGLHHPFRRHGRARPGHPEMRSPY